jgi:3-hydroxyacyl-CoA dehydrogenase/enoyl-CoA hydratase/3-hydroxybutyryl-CoA epimerase
MEILFQGKAFRLEKDGKVGVLNFDLEGEKVNKLGEKPLRELEEICLNIQQGKYPLKSLLIRSSKKNSFIVGADINVIQSLKDESQANEASSLGQLVFSKVEDLPIPTLAAIHGACMGGGTELSLSCRYRICSDYEKTAIGLPEVKLGILPGWGGTFRLPKLVGLMSALDMILAGKSIYASKAGKIGLVHQVVPADMFEEKSLEYAHELADGKDPFKSVRKENLQEKLLTKNPVGRWLFFKKAKEQLLKTTKGHYPAPLKSLELIRDHGHLPRDAYLKEEARVFAELWATDVSKNLVRLFFLTEDVKRNPGTTEIPENELKQLKGIQHLGVLGAGVMGGGIAYTSANAGIRVNMKDIRMEAVGKGLAHASDLFNKELKKKKIKQYQKDQKMSLLRGQTDFSGFASLDLVIEAVVEDLNIKQKVFSELETKVREDAIIATNTSSLRLEDMLPAFQKPERFVGLHFFNPVHKMPLVEVVTHPQISAQTIARSVAYVKSIGKTPVVVKDGPGFLVNRLLLPWLNEAGHCLVDGYDILEMDYTLKQFGMPMGPFELLDEIGLDVACKVGHILHKSLGERFSPADVLDKIVEDNKKRAPDAQRLGKKSSLGFYHWKDGRRQDLDEDEIYNFAPNSNANRISPESDDLIARMIYPMINETAVLLEAGIVEQPWQVDVGMIFGTGFPPFRGGLCRYADTVGLDKIVEKLNELSEKHGPRLKASDSLVKLAKTRNSFYVQ